MIEQTAQEWGAFCTAFAQYVNHLDRVSARHVNSQNLKDETKALAQLYFRHVRPLLNQFPLEELVEPVSIAIQGLLELSEARSLAASYKRNTKTVRKLLPKITSQLEMQGGAAAARAGTSPAEQVIIDTLTKLVTSAAQSYQQAIVDLADTGRISFRGPAHELRESLREVLDQIAPDDDVIKSPNFKLEPGRPKPTMKQKVRFIFGAREKSRTESAAPEGAVNTIDGLVADLTRSIYDHGSLAAHVQRGRRSVEQLKRYVDVIFHDLLEL